MLLMPPRAHSISAGRPAAPDTAPFPVLHGLLESAKGIAVRCLCLGDLYASEQTMLLRFQSCARKLRDRKPSLFNAFEIFDHTGHSSIRSRPLLEEAGSRSECLGAADALSV